MHFPALPGRTNHLPAGVLVPLLLSEGRAEVVLEQRPSTMREHPGEIALPGGRLEESDRDLSHTALREAHEELGIQGARVLGTLSSYPLYTSDYRLHPTVALLRDARFEPNPGEVARVLRWDLMRALERPFIDGIPWQLGDEEYLCPVFRVGVETPAFGGTAQVLYDMLRVFGAALGRDIPETRAGRYQWQDVIPG